MNAHINLDLGVTASELGGGGSIDAVRADFDAVNDVLGELVDGCQAALGTVSRGWASPTGSAAAVTRR